jgi:ribosomal protein S12 methylthiotransferase accessory factor
VTQGEHATASGRLDPIFDPTEWLRAAYARLPHTEVILQLGSAGDPVSPERPDLPHDWLTIQIREPAQTQPLSSGAGRVVIADTASLPILDHTFDAIFAAQNVSLDRIGEFADVLRECRRVSKPHSRLLAALTIAGAGLAGTPADAADSLLSRFAEAGYRIENCSQGGAAEPGAGTLLISAILTSFPAAEERIWAPMGTSWRQYEIGDALRVAACGREFAGVTRIARLDGLDASLAPVFGATRPLSAIEITISGGKGTSVEEARTSALFEAIEIAAAEKQLPRIAYSEQALPPTARFLASAELAAVPVSGEIAWTTVYEYPTFAPVLSPTVAVGMLPADGPFRPCSNGLASDLTFHGALLHGVLEILERHAYSLALLEEYAPSINLKLLQDPFIKGVVERAGNQGLVLDLRDLSSYTGLPTLLCILVDPAGSTVAANGLGLGCHPDAPTAARRAIAEAVQSRVTAVAGAREDIQRVNPAGMGIEISDIFRYWLEPTPNPTAPPRSLCDCGGMKPADALQQVLSAARARDCNLGSLFFFVFPSPPQTWVVRVILAGAECFGLFRNRVSRRIATLLQAERMQS